MSVVLDAHLIDGIHRAALHRDDDVRRLGVDCVPNQLDDRAYGVALVSETCDVVVAGGEHEVFYEARLRKNTDKHPSPRHTQPSSSV